MSSAETGYGTQEPPVPLTQEEKDELERSLINAREIWLARLERREAKLLQKPVAPSEEEVQEREYCDALAKKILAKELDPEKFFDLTPR